MFKADTRIIKATSRERLSPPVLQHSTSLWRKHRVAHDRADTHVFPTFHPKAFFLPPISHPTSLLSSIPPLKIFLYNRPWLRKKS